MPAPAPSAKADSAARGERLPRTVGNWWSLIVRSERVRDLISFQVSLVVHCGLLLLLAMILLIERQEPGMTLTLTPQQAADGPPEMLEMALDASQLAHDDQSDSPSESRNATLPNAFDVPSPSTQKSLGGAPVVAVELVKELPSHELLLISEAPSGGGLEGRTKAERARLAASRGGNAASENAVELGLAWLAAHQLQDGSWRLDHNHADGPCVGRCTKPGQKLETPIGATGLALLPFLGAGYTHTQGPYKDVVDRGLKFLVGKMKVTQRGGDLQWDTTVGMYAQGIATLALCEAYAMTGDQTLEPYAQKAIDFIADAQHPAGGWRYGPQQPGDTTVTGWQIMAMKSGRLARLYVPSPVTERTKEFLNKVQDGRGAFYGYLRSEKLAGTTAVGLLLRMYLGWTRQDDRLQRGTTFLSNLGPSESDMYFNYYATQVLHHQEGPTWEPWNKEMRDYLVGKQATGGHERGSWFFFDPHGAVGGRHYTTAICTMILEVYYRYMPLYGEQAVEEEF
jgi:hypothetical protein